MTTLRINGVDGTVLADFDPKTSKAIYRMAREANLSVEEWVLTSLEKYMEECDGHIDGTSSTKGAFPSEGTE